CKARLGFRGAPPRFARVAARRGPPAASHCAEQAQAPRRPKPPRHPARPRSAFPCSPSRRTAAVPGGTRRRANAILD
ncbi:MAG: hypothetical protein AVDCRST_MAG04-1824, partial [uncultured Acetobacteraceae bacterium]